MSVQLGVTFVRGIVLCVTPAAQLRFNAQSYLNCVAGLGELLWRYGGTRTPRFGVGYTVPHFSGVQKKIALTFFQHTLNRRCIGLNSRSFQKYGQLSWTDACRGVEAYGPGLGRQSHNVVT